MTTRATMSELYTTVASQLMIQKYTKRKPLVGANPDSLRVILSESFKQHCSKSTLDEQLIQLAALIFGNRAETQDFLAPRLREKYIARIKDFDSKKGTPALVEQFFLFYPFLPHLQECLAFSPFSAHENPTIEHVLGEFAIAEETLFRYIDDPNANVGSITGEERYRITRLLSSPNFYALQLENGKKLSWRAAIQQWCSAFPSKKLNWRLLRTTLIFYQSFIEKTPQDGAPRPPTKPPRPASSSSLVPSSSSPLQEDSAAPSLKKFVEDLRWDCFQKLLSCELDSNTQKELLHAMDDENLALNTVNSYIFKNKECLSKRTFLSINLYKKIRFFLPLSNSDAGYLLNMIHHRQRSQNYEQIIHQSLASNYSRAEILNCMSEVKEILLSHQVLRNFHFLFFLSYVFYSGKENLDSLLQFVSHTRSTTEEKKHSHILKRATSKDDKPRPISPSILSTGFFSTTSVFKSGTTPTLAPLSDLAEDGDSDLNQHPLTQSQKSSIPFKTKRQFSLPRITEIRSFSLRKRSASAPTEPLSATIPLNNNAFPLLWKDFLDVEKILKSLQNHLGDAYLNQQNLLSAKKLLAHPQARALYFWVFIEHQSAEKKTLELLQQGKAPGQPSDFLTQAGITWGTFFSEHLETLNCGRMPIESINLLQQRAFPHTNLQVHTDTLSSFPDEMFNRTMPLDGTASRAAARTHESITRSRALSTQLEQTSEASVKQKLEHAFREGFVEANFYLIQRASWKFPEGQKPKPPLKKIRRVLEFMHTVTGAKRQATISLDLTPLKSHITLKPPPQSSETDDHYYAISKLFQVLTVYFERNRDYESSLEQLATEIYPKNPAKKKLFKEIITSFNEEVTAKATLAMAETYSSEKSAPHQVEESKQSRNQH